MTRSSDRDPIELRPPAKAPGGVVVWATEPETTPPGTAPSKEKRAEEYLAEAPPTKPLNASSFILYDGECPICRQYMALAALRTLRPDIAALDARTHPEHVSSMRAAGYEVNDSIIVHIASKGRVPARTYMGGDATRMILDLSSSNAAYRRLALWVIGGAPWRHVLYPYLRGSRNMLLRLNGKPLVP